MRFAAIFAALTVVPCFSCGQASSPDPERGAFLLEDVDSVLNASRSVEYLVAPASAELEAIQNTNDGWRPNERPVFDRGFSTDVYWLRLRLQNDSRRGDWYLTLRNNRLNFVDFFLVADARMQTRTAGDNRPLAPDAPASYPVFDFRLDPGETATLFVRIATDTHISFPVRFYSPEEFGARRNLTMIFHLLFLVLIGAFIVFQARLNPTVRGPTEGFLILAVVSLGLWALSYYGEGARLFWPNWIWARDNLNYVFVLSYLAFLAFFLPHYLLLREFYPRLFFSFYWLGGVIQACNLFFILFQPPNHTKSNITSILALLVFTLMIVGIVQSLRKKHLWVLYLLSSWIVLAIATAATTFMLLGWLPYNFFTHNAGLIAFPVDLVVIGVSMLIRHRELKRNRDDLQLKLDELMRLPERQNERQDIREQRVRNLDVSGVLESLAEYFAAEKPFLDENLSLTTVASRLDLRPDQLSAILNKEMNLPFAVLVNEYRFREACRMMAEHPDMNLLRIAFDCGFGSRTSFNRVFKQRTGLPPVEYRRRLVQQEAISPGSEA